MSDAPTPSDPRIEDYAVIGNGETMALVHRCGSVDWLCLPRFDSPACFAALLGTPENGRWLIAPQDEATSSRSYRDGSLVLETRFETPTGVAVLIDFMTREAGAATLVRLVRGVSGRVRMKTSLRVRFDYGATTPWASRAGPDRLEFVAGPDRLTLSTDAPLRGEDFSTVGEFQVGAGESVAFRLQHSASYRPAPALRPAERELEAQEAEWRAWSGRFDKDWPRPDLVLRSLIVLKGLAHWETGGIVAAATTSLPEKLGGSRNWDYRYCWLRDATFTLYALMGAGYLDEAQAWRDWLIRAAAGSPADLQIMYGVAGERRLEEREVDHLSGFAGSRPVRVGNAAAGQLQLDVYGEVVNALYMARRAGLGRDEVSWALETALLEHLEEIWSEPDEGIWEVRGGRRHFTHSKVMAWTAFDRGARSVEEFGMEGPADRWRALADRIHAEVCERAFHTGRRAFTQSYGSEHLDAATLIIPLTGFLPPDDPRVLATVAAIESDLMRNGFVLRYDTGSRADGLPPGEGAFLACTCWLADNYVLQGRLDEARTLFKRVTDCANDVGLFSEEVDFRSGRQLGNFPQAFSHLALVNTAHNIAEGLEGPAHRRAREGRPPRHPHRRRGR